MRQRFSSIDREQQVWVDHPLRAIREIERDIRDAVPRIREVLFGDEATVYCTGEAAAGDPAFVAI